MLDAFIQKLVTAIVNPLVIFLFFLAVIMFLWGVIQFIRGADSDEARITGRRHMIWGIFGIFVMTAAVAIINVLVRTVFN